MEEAKDLHALFFEMRPKPGHLDHYFDHVARLRPALSRHEGLVFLDRYRCLSDPEILLSHQLWANEDAILAWRRDEAHRRSQAAGRNVHFADYRIRVGERVLRQPPDPSDAMVERQDGSSSSLVIALYGTKPMIHPAFTTFESLNRECRYISLGSFDSHPEARAALALPGKPSGVEETAVYIVRRDYGKFDRDQAPR